MLGVCESGEIEGRVKEKRGELFEREWEERQEGRQ